MSDAFGNRGKVYEKRMGSIEFPSKVTLPAFRSPYIEKLSAPSSVVQIEETDPTIGQESRIH
jgi:hypothetical protein